MLFKYINKIKNKIFCLRFLDIYAPVIVSLLLAAPFGLIFYLGYSTAYFPDRDIDVSLKKDGYIIEFNTELSIKESKNIKYNFRDVDRLVQDYIKKYFNNKNILDRNEKISDIINDFNKELKIYLDSYEIELDEEIKTEIKFNIYEDYFKEKNEN